MSPEPELKPLFQSIGLDREEIHARCRYLDWSPADGRRLNRHAARLESAHVEFVDDLYDYLRGFDPLARILSEPATLDRLKRSQITYYQQLLNGPYDYQYVHDRLRVGMVHERVGLELKWYLGAYRLHLDAMLTNLFPADENRELYASLLKVVFFHMSLAVEAYSAARRRALEDSEARFARALRGSNDGIWDWDVVTDRLYVSERWASMLGLSRDSLGESGQHWFQRVHPDDLPALRQAIDTHLRGETPWLYLEYRMRRPDGTYIWVLVRGVAERDSQGDVRLTGSQTDISERKQAEAELRRAARHDPLTGLANRTRLDELLHRALQRQRKFASEAALLFIDLDRFKLINDSLGHAVGDLVLVEMAQRLKQCLRPGDHLTRFGGDEFVVLLDELDCQDDAEHLAQRMLDALQQPVYVHNHELVFSASIGIAALDCQAQPGEALQAADIALYSAKAAGKSQYARYTHDMHSAAQHRLELQSALAQALARKEFVVHYQPIYQLEGEQSTVYGVEALLRWRLNDQPVSPQVFIPALEETGDILPVGDWVLEQACREVRAWQQTGQSHLHCSVNLSSRQLRQAGFAARVAAILQASGLEAQFLVLEITEGLLMEDSPELHHNLRALARLGVRLALDDFGTGYCSLGYLQRFPLHILKVDKSFVMGLPQDREQSAICRAIIGLGKSLGLQVIAEGVETEQHRQFLLDEGCQHAQGFWFARPCSSQDMQQLFNALDSGGLLAGHATPAVPVNQALSRRELS